MSRRISHASHLDRLENVSGSVKFDRTISRDNTEGERAQAARKAAGLGQLRRQEFQISEVIRNPLVPESQPAVPDSRTTVSNSQSTHGPLEWLRKTFSRGHGERPLTVSSATRDRVLPSGR